jgi:hypothetical protein
VSVCVVVQFFATRVTPHPRALTSVTSAPSLVVTVTVTVTRRCRRFAAAQAAAMAPRPHRPPWSEDVRWMVVFRRLHRGQSWRHIRKALRGGDGRPVVVLDNASIHKSRRFARMVRRAGGIVRFTPPYAYDCSLLDNGAFGLVVRFLKRRGKLVERVGLQRGLDAAFKRIGRRAARYCFHNCGYHQMRA